MEIQVGKEYKTRGGLKAIIYATDAGGKYPIHGAVVVDDGTKNVYEWDESGGVYDISYSNMDIISEWIETLQFDWDCLPKWADRWIAVNDNGDWWSYEERPSLGFDPYWRTEFIEIEIPESHTPKNFTGDWKDSLHENPKYK